MEGKRNPESNQRGFTLLEIMMVLILIFIVGGIAFMSFNRMGINSELRTAARDIAAEFQLARQRAMAENTPLTISFNTSTHSYRVPTPGGGTLTKSLSDYGGGITITSLTVPGGAVSILPRGTTDQPGRIVLVNSRTSTATIDITATGRANVTFSMH